MELIERYLQAVRFWLPKQQKQDIIAELSDDIYAQIEEQESSLGRKLTEAEVGAILKQRGRPVLVANRYLPQQHLIGPVLFPIYVFVLKVVMLFYVVPWLLVWISLLIYSPAYRSEHANHWADAVGSLWSSSWFSVFVSAGVVTLVFALLERVQAQSGFLENWDPRKLPPVRSPNVISRSTSMFEFAINFFIGMWMTTHFSSSPVVMNRPDLRIVLSDDWRYFFWGFVLLALLNAGLSATNLLRPYWTAQRAIFRLLTDLEGSVLFCWLMRANIVAEIVVANVAPARALEITNGINFWTGRMFPAAVIVGVSILSVDAYRVVRVRWGCSAFTQASTVSKGSIL